MIGQKYLRQQIDSMDNVPPFIILVGQRGSGRRLIANYIADRLDCELVEADGHGMSDIDGIMQQAYFINDVAVYYLHDADMMSVAAKNSTLKLCEEPPNLAHIIFSIQDLSMMLDTIRSRAIILFMDKYTKEELEEYSTMTYQTDEVNVVCETPGDVDLMHGKDGFWEYVNKVYSGINEVSLANSFRIAEKIALKDEEDKFDLRLFWKAYITMCIVDGEALAAKHTTHCINKLKIRGINKQQLFDMWLFKIRGVYGN